MEIVVLFGRRGRFDSCNLLYVFKGGEV